MELHENLNVSKEYPRYDPQYNETGTLHARSCADKGAACEGAMVLGNWPKHGSGCSSF